jgi:hypothetical protein
MAKIKKTDHGATGTVMGVLAGVTTLKNYVAFS